MIKREFSLVVVLTARRTRRRDECGLFLVFCSRCWLLRFCRCCVMLCCGTSASSLVRAFAVLWWGVSREKTVKKTKLRAQIAQVSSSSSSSLSASALKANNKRPADDHDSLAAAAASMPPKAMRSGHAEQAPSASRSSAAAPPLDSPVPPATRAFVARTAPYVDFSTRSVARERAV